MLYDITLKIDYVYDNAVDVSRHITHLVPMDLPGTQRLIAGALTVQSKPQEWINRVDFFGNRAIEIAYTQPLSDIVFAVQARVERFEPVIGDDHSPPIDELANDIAGHRGLDAMSPHHYLGPSPRVQPGSATTGYARSIITANQTAVDAVVAIGKALHADMRYDPKATTVETPMAKAFEGRHGVCQDFSHIMIACLRGIGIPAGYVSGFLQTRPPPGRPRLAGADAMHAWVRAWCGSTMGWVEYDPTNAVMVGTDHIVVARGRDYFDVAPIKGIMRTYGQHVTKQSVDVIPVLQPVK